MENIFKILHRTFKITVSEPVEIYKLDEQTGLLLYVENSDTIDTEKCPPIPLNETYDPLFKAIPLGVMQILVEEGDINANIKIEDLNNTYAVEDAILDLVVENYETLEDYNILVEEVVEE